jgi:hypothetical protein
VSEHQRQTLTIQHHSHWIDSDKMNKVVKCAECECTPSECKINVDFRNSQRCVNCIKEDTCCCFAIHVIEENECCNNKKVGNCNLHRSDHVSGNIDISKKKSLSDPQKGRSVPDLSNFLLNVKSLYAAALGIEILCIASAEIGENTGLYFFGLNPWGIAIAYVMGYSLAGFTTFTTILGRYNNLHHHDKSTVTREMDSCCSALEQDTGKGFLCNLKSTFTTFAIGSKRLFQIRNQQGLKIVLKSSLFILVTAESACILTAETVDLIFYQYSIFLSVPLALIAGAFTVVVPAAYRKSRHSNANA